MSFILDALRKSENQRQRNTTPGIADARVSARSDKRSYWKVVVGVLVALNAALLLALWLRPGEQAPTATVRQPASRPPAQSAPAAANRRLTQAMPSPETRTTTEPSSAVPAPAGSPSSSAPTRPPETTAPAYTTPAPTAINSSNAPSQSSSIPSLETLQLQGIITLPPQRVDLHVYSDIPADRLVFINMKKLREGDQLTDGPVIQEITPDGIIMTHNGSRFFMSRD